MKLSIIIPMYNTIEYIMKLLFQLEKQMVEGIEVIVVDDHSDTTLPINYNPNWLKKIRLEENSGGASKPRNIGLDNAKGEYITFIDSDDMVADNYLQKIMKAIDKKPDIIYISWKSKAQQVTMNIRPPKWNCAVWCRVYKREIIGNTRFDENLRIAEDWKFNEAIKYQKSVCIKDTIYFYNNGRKGSLLNGGAK